LPYGVFLKASLSAVNKMELSEFSEYLPGFLEDENRDIEVVYPSSTLISQEMIEHLKQLLDGIECYNPLLTEETSDDIEVVQTTNAVFNGPSFELLQNHRDPLSPLPFFFTSESTDLFYQLPLENWEKKHIYTIVSTMAEKNVMSLLLEKKRLEKKGKDVNHVHPMRFIGHVFADPYLKRCMATIKKSSFKWNGFIDGYAKRMKEEAHKNNLLPHVPGFCEAVKADPAQVTHLIQHRDWEGLIRYLVKS
jgi:hypothetical protein